MNNKPTPYFRYHQANLEQSIKDFKVFEKDNIGIFYAIKSNTYEPLIRTLVRNGYGFDIASWEEIKLVRKLGGKPKKMSFSSPTKLPEEIRKASGIGVEYYAFDSLFELEKIMENAKTPKLIARMAVHNKDKSSQDLSGIFGMGIEYYEQVLKIASKKKWPICGLTFHVGSQNTSVSSWEEALEDMGALIKLSEKYGIKISCLNIGGGIPVPYDEETRPTSYFIEKISGLLKDFKKKHQIDDLIIEPGRAISASSMSLVTTIVNIKEYKEPPILVTDASVFNGLVEILEHTEYPIVEYEKSSSHRKKFKVCGMSCDGYDIIKGECSLPEDIKVGEKLIINCAGAYTFVYGNFHMRGYPKIYR